MVSYLRNMLDNFNKKTDLFNPEYKPGNIHDYSRCNFARNKVVNGAYFKTKSQNEYYSFISKTDTVYDATTKRNYFMPLKYIRDTTFNPTTDNLMKFVMEDDEEYFVESNSSITLLDNSQKVRVEIIPTDHTTFEKLEKTTKFEPIPEYNPHNPLAFL